MKFCMLESYVLCERICFELHWTEIYVFSCYFKRSSSNNYVEGESISPCPLPVYAEDNALK